ncbi:MAG: sensor histidine kinase, partial [Candidatus Accumulibacter sp.]|nr:sensor histidine kinase [Accumulibacter sp.]
HKVFDRFYRADGSDGEGSGLGLAIVREIAEVHQAAASLRPKTGDAGGEAACGCIARIVFPLRRLQPSRLPIPAATTRTGFA